MNILYIGEPRRTRENYLRGIIPSHWFYGACEMEKEGHTVFWEQERPALFHDLVLIHKHKPDMVFIPNLNMRAHVLLLLLAALHIIKLPIYAYLHHGAQPMVRGKHALYRFLLRGVTHLFFLSAKSMMETVVAGWVKANRCTLPGWGADMDFYNKVPTTDKGCFVSTGKENRDFDTLIEAFRRTGDPLKILTAKSHAGNDHADLLEKTKDITNISVCLTENSGDVYPQMLQAMAEARALVCPLKRDKLNYCVGLSTITDAEGLGKPLIITHNPYHDTERATHFNIVESVEDWVNAIQNICAQKACPLPAPPNMARAYEKMRNVMFNTHTH